MRCPYCNNNETQVKDSRPTEDNAVIRRRRHCADCGGRFTTFERIQLRELTIVKNTGRKVPFDRDKLMRSVQIALRKRPVEQERVERMVSGIVRRLENLGEGEILPIQSEKWLWKVFLFLIRLLLSDLHLFTVTSEKLKTLRSFSVICLLLKGSKNSSAHQRQLPNRVS